MTTSSGQATPTKYCARHGSFSTMGTGSLRPPEPLYRPGSAETLGRDPQRPTGRRPGPPLPPAREPQAQAVEVEVHDGGGVEGEQLAHDEPAHDGDAERTTQLDARARAQRHRQRAQHGRPIAT